MRNDRTFGKRMVVMAAAIGASASLLTLGDAAAQEGRSTDISSATIYRDIGFNGPAVAVDRPNADLGLAWPVNSIRIVSGRWQLCERPNYRGGCRTVERDTAMLGNPLRGITVQSIRPVGGGGGGGGGGNFPEPPVAPDQTARGNFAEFHTVPQRGGRRIEACANGRGGAACAARTADQYCRSIGWGGSAREHQETVGRSIYLADVLCVRSGF